MQNVLTFHRATHASPVAIAMLLAANVVPLAGVLLWGWDLATLVALYWLENGVVGLFAIGRILTAQGSGLPAGRGARVVAVPPRVADPALILARIVLVPFFIVHYGLFWVAHGVFVWTALPAMFAAAGAPETVPDGSAVLAVGIAMLASHGVSFFLNWIGAGENRSSTPMAEMSAPYTRVVILHMTILVGAFAVAILGAPIWALVVMVGIKTSTDLSAHLAERGRAAGRLVLT